MNRPDPVATLKVVTSDAVRATLAWEKPSPDFLPVLSCRSNGLRGSN